MTAIQSDPERKRFWEVYEKVDSKGKKGMVKLAGSLLDFQLLSEGKKPLLVKRGKRKVKSQILP